MKHVRSSSLLAGTSSFGEFSTFYLKDVKLYDNINKISSIIIPPEKIIDTKTDFNHIYTLSNSEKYVHHYCNCYIMCNVKEKGDKERRLFLDVQNIRDELRGVVNQLEDSAVTLIKDLKKYVRELE